MTPAAADYRAAVELHNLLGRDLTFYDDDGRAYGVARAEGRVWVSADYQQIGMANMSPTSEIEIPLVRSVNERVVGLPDPVPGRLYVVSGLVAAMMEDRTDLACPAQMMRSAGKVQGPKSLMLR